MRSWWDEITQKDCKTEWLILGKGPTFTRRAESDLSRYQLLGLNHVIREQPVDIAHVIDLDVITSCEERVWLHNCHFLVMPLYPHVGFRPSVHPLDHHVAAIPVLEKLHNQNRLLWYNLSTAGRMKHREGSPVVGVRYFSAEAALNLLVMAGMKNISTLGIDGGTEYAPEFSNLKPLTNGQLSFDVQMRELDNIARKHQINVQRLFDVENRC